MKTLLGTLTRTPGQPDACRLRKPKPRVARSRTSSRRMTRRKPSTNLVNPDADDGRKFRQSRLSRTRNWKSQNGARSPRRTGEPSTPEILVANAEDDIAQARVTLRDAELALDNDCRQPPTTICKIAERDLAVARQNLDALERLQPAQVGARDTSRRRAAETTRMSFTSGLESTPPTKTSSMTPGGPIRRAGLQPRIGVRPRLFPFVPGWAHSRQP